MTTVEQLGETTIYRQVRRATEIDSGLASQVVPVFVIWCDPPLDSTLAALAAMQFSCPGCDQLIPFGRPGGITAAVAETPNCGNVTDQCQACGAQWAFDSTVEDLRAALRWPSRAARAIASLGVQE